MSDRASGEAMHLNAFNVVRRLLEMTQASKNEVTFSLGWVEKATFEPSL